MASNALLNGILLINKPEGLTSNGVLQRVKRILGVKKAGHTGSLDPMATGMLPICLGEATKLCQYLLDADKSYDVSGCLGVTTDTGDATGQVLTHISDVHCLEEEFKSVLKQFVGVIQQVPPMYSALKHQGKPLYRYARQGISIDRKAREVMIRNLIFHELSNPSFSLTVTCSKGTYIRTLVEDIGAALGVGAHMTKLHRCYTAGFEHEPMWTLESLLAMDNLALSKTILPMDHAIKHLPSCQLTPEELIKIRHGQSILSPVSFSYADQEIRLYDSEALFVGIGIWQKNTQQILAKRLLSW